MTEPPPEILETSSEHSSGASEEPELHRALGLGGMLFYGVGDILGAGIYALVGVIAGIAGSATWISFAITICIAGLTALSYAELGARLPRSGGEAFYCDRAFGRPALSLMIGWLVLTSGVVSMATVSLVASRYVLASVAEPSVVAEKLIILVFLVALAGVTFWGIRQSSAFNIVCTLVEGSGLLIVIVLGLIYIMGDSGAAAAQVTAPSDFSLLAIAQGSALAFYAFIGFEDMVNVAEEVKNPQRNLPIAILVSLGVAGVIYILISWVATNVMAPADLAEAEGPLIEVVRTARPGFPVQIFSVIALFAVANTGLLNFVMGSRLLFGMSRQGLLPKWFAAIHRRTRTPYHAVAVIFAAALALALTGSVTYLAGTTNALLLLVFVTVNMSLVAIRSREGRAAGIFAAPIWVAWTGAVSCLILIYFLPRRSLLTGAMIVGAGAVIIALRWKDLGAIRKAMQEGGEG